MYIWRLNKCSGNELKSPNYTEIGCVGPSVTQGSADECRGRNTFSCSTERDCYQSFNHALVTQKDLVRNNTKISIDVVGKSSNKVFSSLVRRTLSFPSFLTPTISGINRQHKATNFLLGLHYMFCYLVLCGIFSNTCRFIKLDCLITSETNPLSLALYYSFNLLNTFLTAFPS